MIRVEIGSATEPGRSVRDTFEASRALAEARLASCRKDYGVE